MVELVDGTGTGVGACTVAEAHRPPGRIHRAFSILLYDAASRVLLQRRATSKTRFPGRWSNTCCGHPAPAQDLVLAAAARLRAELGLAVELREVGVFSYYATDAATGYVESEWDHVLVGALDTGEPEPDPVEVSETVWLSPAVLRAELAMRPREYTPWLLGVLDTAEPHLPN